jgi:DNA invertase Pin-like site-specific DNA recombinase
VVRSEKKSGTTREGRAELATLLEFLRDGDVLVITRLDRLARSVADLQGIVKTLRDKGVALKTTDGMAFDTSTAMGKCFLDMLGVFAEFETSLRRERQMAGIAAAKAKGVYKGRPSSINPAAVQRLKDEGHGPAAIAKRLGISRASVYRLAPEPKPAPTLQTVAQEAAE